jgi:hypothetical protein
MFLDLLGDPADQELIESMAVRLLGGQELDGGWSYNCPAISQEETQRLESVLQARPAGGAAAEPKGQRDVRDLSPAIQKQLEQVRQQQLAKAAEGGTTSDNSNTQFAVLALWIARRQGMPVEATMQRIQARYHNMQNPDGGWSYRSTANANVPPRPPNLPPGVMMGAPGNGTRSTMTCSGLLGLALGHGSAMEATMRAGGLPGLGSNPRPRSAADPGKDPAVRAGFQALGRFLQLPFETLGNEDRVMPGRPGGAGQPPAGAGGPPPGVGGPPPGVGGPPPGVGGPPGPKGQGKAYYFLFSLERVAVAYGLERIGNKDWYEWGANHLLRHQGADGGWTGEFEAAGSDTCFAILFLRRANLAKDLSAVLKGIKDVKDVPATAKEQPSTTPPSVPATGGPRSDPPPVGARVPEARPAAEPAGDPAITRLTDELLQAPPENQGEVLKKLRDSKGPAYTDALALAIHKMNGAAKERARDALADRLTRMSAKTLGDKLQDEDPEVRRAGALACAMKDDRSNVPRLIDLLRDPEMVVGRAAHAALRALTKQDFGMENGAAWKDWWSKNGDR